jgi:peroxiredoxin (alkyl hydroperoxide reductase subunit C)
LYIYVYVYYRVVLFFYPLDFTFVCPTEIIEFSDRSDEFRKINTEVIGASIDSKFSHLAWTQTARNKGGLGQLKIPLLADVTRQVAKDYGVLLDDQGHSLRATFIINPSGIILHAQFNSPAVGRNVEETLRLVQGYQYAEIHGEVCPSGWKPGSSTIKPNPTQKLEYFEKVNKH